MLHSRLLFFLAVGPIFASCQDGPIVNISLGSILGVIQTSRNGTDFYSFRGIHYAQAPIGELRFKPPKSVEPWDGILNATVDGPICYQSRFTEHSEDCLVLNVYTHRINHTENLRPVLFYIHGGSFVLGSSHSKLRGPDYLMDRDIVLVTINYRLGALGFFSTGDKHSPGNYGMKDQLLALKWVRAHIRSFGGDPSRITLAGESAGAASVGLHLISPLSRGLFHGAVLLSGSPFGLWVTNKDSINLGKKQALLLNCSTENTEIMVDCIKKIPAEDIIDTSYSLLQLHGKGVFYSPVVEPDDESERFLVKNPLISLLEGDIADVPIVIGTTKDEMIGRAKKIFDQKDLAENLSRNWTSSLPVMAIYKPNDTITEKLKEFYLGNFSHPLTNDSMQGLGQLISDGIIIFGVVRTTKLLSTKLTKPIYFYQFNFKGDYSILKWPGTNDPVGVMHGDDLSYVFHKSNFYPRFSTTGKEGKVVNKLTLLWKNFIYTGNPTPEPSESLDNVVWVPYTNNRPMYFDINENLSMVDGLYYQERMALWESLFPLPKS